MLMDQRVTWMKKRIDFVSPGNCGLVRLVFFPQHIQADLRFTLPCLSNRQHPFLKNLTLLSRCFSASSLCRCCSSCWRITMPGTSVEFLQYLQYLRPVFWRLGLCSWKLCLKNDDDDVVWKMIQLFLLQTLLSFIKYLLDWLTTLFERFNYKKISPQSHIFKERMPRIMDRIHSGNNSYLYKKLCKRENILFVEPRTRREIHCTVWLILTEKCLW